VGRRRRVEFFNRDFARRVEENATMVRAILEDGVIRPLENLPTHWAEGQELVIDEASAPSPQELDAWSREVDELAAEIPPEDFERLDEALAKADREAKSYIRRQMGLD
jgi:hypothetical protein